MSISGLSYLEVPIVIIDTETTGLDPVGDKIVEISLVKIEPDQEPKLILDTLVNPEIKVRGTSIHGISDLDVQGAPTFKEIAGNIIEAIDGSILASYNVYFDLSFLQSGLANLKIDFDIPYFCLMYMRPMLKIGKKCPLTDACNEEGIKIEQHHRASSDALSGAHLWKRYKSELQNKNIATFGEMTKLGTYKFLQSFKRPLFKKQTNKSLNVSNSLKARSKVIDDKSKRLNEYWEALKTTFYDFEISNDEIDYLKSKIQFLKLSLNEIKYLHAKFFSGVLIDYMQDFEITEYEDENLRFLYNSLKRIGWAPGFPEI
ncbi:3'-5' exonuclease [Leptospira sp. FAT2]|uniref:3'-5' exonuclease n=1 Tax=Leptospira sanjuanensis TaxID=2879643 RepID=UPI001EE92A8D|nr:3'-5' exonuclease [Leptospira sanjuanensis]MCG6195490.1 3'-5' exonuclease [Leptospira sanjuanensis]